LSGHGGKETLLLSKRDTEMMKLKGKPVTMDAHELQNASVFLPSVFLFESQGRLYCVMKGKIQQEITGESLSLSLSLSLSPTDSGRYEKREGTNCSAGKRRPMRLCMHDRMRDKSHSRTTQLDCLFLCVKNVCSRFCCLSSSLFSF
jgi:hypothetical protein